MKAKYPIFVISKGRPECITSKALSRMEQPHFVVIEPQERLIYEEKKSKFATLIETNFSNLGQGSIPVRNFVWDYSTQINDRHWIIDDNIFNFRIIENGKRIVTNDSAIFTKCEDFTDNFTNVPMSGMNYSTFAIPGKKLKPFTQNTRIYSCILLSNKEKIYWRGRYNEDTDLSLRFLKKGFCTILFNYFLIDKTATLTMKGGNEEIYKQTNNRYEFALSLKKQHPDVVEIIWKYNRYHHKVNYSPFKENKFFKKI